MKGNLRIEGKSYKYWTEVVKKHLEKDKNGNYVCVDGYISICYKEDKLLHSGAIKYRLFDQKNKTFKDMINEFEKRFPNQKEVENFLTNEINMVSRINNKDKSIKNIKGKLVIDKRLFTYWIETNSRHYILTKSGKEKLVPGYIDVCYKEEKFRASIHKIRILEQEDKNFETMLDEFEENFYTVKLDKLVTKSIKNNL